ncbi:MAG: fumarylacetoacetate hydrolase family protein [Caldilineaceae bacterium]|nr:fumarylacetoacetate hydrolase family protein [Caldilineaceae bacterium]MCY4092986.1 fumarylacetoacetate hydrolase family protein [Caldilineaceae bacterium]MCY4118150.1 fumarylacetoacetate hydrolase family protein [Caldilineaceae bacterium]MDE0428246.1 fumarylacetoacetate hydrolase family protein [Caldilineaceae bacterium]
MRLLLFDDHKLGVWDGQQVLDASAAVADRGHHSPQEMMEMVIGDWTNAESRIRDAIDGAPGIALDEVTCRPPLPRPGQLVCLAGNYLEPQKPERGLFNAFLKSPNAALGHGGTVVLPDAEASVFHFEPELALVIGKRASRIAAEDAMDHVFGYTQFIDVSARGLPGGFFLGKSWHTFAPMGPLLVTRDEVPDANDLGVRLWVNDEQRHDITTADMDRHIPELLAEVTNVLPLEPGDVVSTGTHHFGLEPVQEGDTIRLEIEQLGPALVVKCQDPSGRSW